MNNSLTLQNQHHHTLATKRAVKAGVIALSLSMASSAVFAAEEKVEKAYQQPTFIGLSSGMIIGAIIGGPAGAAVAGTLGTLIGNAKESDDKRAQAELTLEQTTQTLQQRNHEKQQLLSKLQQAESQQAQLNHQLSLAQQTINNVDTLEQIKLNLQFKSGSFAVENFYQSQVKQLAQLVKENPQLHIQLTGHADRNGDDASNLTLSQQRIEAVKNLSITNGINEQKIITTALGENAPMHNEQNYQNDFYDRRVEIQLTPEHVLTAGN